MGTVDKGRGLKLCLEIYDLALGGLNESTLAISSEYDKQIIYWTLLTVSG